MRNSNIRYISTGWRRRQGKKREETSSKKGYSSSPFVFAVERSSQRKNLLWMFKNKQRQQLQRGKCISRLLCQVAPDVLPYPFLGTLLGPQFPFSLHFPFEFAPRRVVKFHLPLPWRLLSLFLSQIETEIKFASCWIFVLVLAIFSFFAFFHRRAVLLCLVTVFVWPETKRNTH